MLRSAVVTIGCVILVLAMGMDLPQTEPKEEGLLQERYTEIIIKIKPETIVMPEGDYKAPLSLIEIRSDALKALNTKFNLIGIERLFTGKKGGAIEAAPGAPDLENTFLFKFPDLIDPNEIIKEYEGLDEVIYAEKNEVVTIF